MRLTQQMSYINQNKLPSESEFRTLYSHISLTTGLKQARLTKINQLQVTMTADEPKNRQAEIERVQKSSNWFNKIPFISFPKNWLVKITPPFGGATVRFRVKGAKDAREISVYLDCYKKLGCFDGPYWEISPYKNGVCKVPMEDVDKLLTKIKESILIEAKIYPKK